MRWDSNVSCELEFPLSISNPLLFPCISEFVGFDILRLKISGHYNRREHYSNDALSQENPLEIYTRFIKLSLIAVLKTLFLFTTITIMIMFYIILERIGEKGSDEDSWSIQVSIIVLLLLTHLLQMHCCVLRYQTRFSLKKLDF